MNIISNAHSQKVYELTSEELIRKVDWQDNVVKLENGTVITDMLDGRYYDKDENQYSEVFEVSDDYPFDDPSSYEGEYKHLGFVEV